MTNSPPRGDRARSIGGRVLVAAGLVVTFVTTVLAGGAAAHHANVGPSTSVVCDAGVLRLDYVATSWLSTDGVSDGGGSFDSWRGLNADVRIDLSINGGGFVEIGQGAFSADDVNAENFPQITGSHDLPIGTTGSLVVRARPVGPWGPGPNGETHLSSIGESGTSDALEIPTGCETPATPAVDADYVCATDKITVSLSNIPAAGPNQVKAPANLQVQIGDYDRTVTVPAGDTVVLEFDPTGDNGGFGNPGLDENETLPLTVTGVNGTVFSDTVDVTRTCLADAQPHAAAVFLCADTGGGGTLTVTLSNDNEVGGESVTFTITRVGEAPEDVTVAGGGTETRDFDVDEDEAITVTVAAPGLPVDETSFGATGDCEDPDASVTVDCDENTITVTFTEPSTATTTYAVTANGTTVTVPDGATSVGVAITTEDSEIVVTVNGEEIHRETFTACDEPPETTTTTAPTTSTTVLSTTITSAPATSAPATSAPTEVQGATQSRTLPRTGTDPTGPLSLAMGLAMVGGGLVLLGEDWTRRLFRSRQ